MIEESGHGVCDEALATRVIYSGPHRVTLCAHTESDIRATVIPDPTDAADRDRVYELVRESVEWLQRALGAER